MFISSDYSWFFAIVGLALNGYGFYQVKYKTAGITLSKQNYNRQIFFDGITYFYLPFGTFVVAIGVPILGAQFDIIYTVLSTILILYSISPTISSTSKILLQTSPHSLKAALSKSLREASSVEGVLECHDEHFWSIGQSVSLIVGSLKVRISKNTNEQSTLATIHKIFSPLLSHLTIQIEKDDWNLKSSAPTPPVNEIEIKID
jgi:Co/Zn/Cd efflux system component